MLAVFAVVFILLLLIGVPISMALGGAALLPGLINDTFTAGGEFITRSMFGGLDSFLLLAIPMFVLSGIIMAKGGISKKLFEVFAFFIGKRTAGMPCAVIVTCLFYGAISGSSPATVAAVGSMSIPMLVNMGYDKVFSTALIAVSGGLGVIIPPSIPFILYGSASGASVGKMFTAGILPGFLIAFFLMGYAIAYCKRNGEDKDKINYAVNGLRSKGFLKVLKESFWALLTPVIILGCIYSGIASPTEAAVISVFYSLIISLFIYKTLEFRDLWDVFTEAIKTYGPILFILSAAVAFSRVLNLLQVPQVSSEWILSTFHSKISVLLVITVFLLIVGMFMETTPAILIITPILVPIVEQFGVDPIHFGIMMVVNLAIGFVTPPMGVNLFIASSLSNVPVVQITKKAIPLLLMFFVALLLITFVPQISLLLLG